MESTKKWAITGGIGSGKTYVSRLLEKKGFPVFYCDDVAKKELATNPQIRSKLIERVGRHVYDKVGNLNKLALAEYICSMPENAVEVNKIVHPVVAQRLDEWFDQQVKTPIVFVECALLFEADWQDKVDGVLMITAPEWLRVQRVRHRDSVSEATVRKWMALQLPEDEKAARANVCIRNDGFSRLDSQINKVLKIIKQDK